MQDRFKLRCFSRRTKKMYEVDSLHLDSKEGEWVWGHYYNPIYDKDLKIQIVQPNAVIMQCTGLKDKNGKLIYEGDILYNPFSNYKYVVNFGEFTLNYVKPFSVNITGFYITYKENIKNEIDSLQMLDLNNIEVIGNIYDNPELLED